MEVRGRLHASTALPRETDRGTHSAGDWLAPGGDLDEMAKKVTPLAGNRTPVVQPVVWSRCWLRITPYSVAW